MEVPNPNKGRELNVGLTNPLPYPVNAP